jgi:hypothetical protein
VIGHHVEINTHAVDEAVAAARKTFIPFFGINLVTREVPYAIILYHAIRSLQKGFRKLTRCKSILKLTRFQNLFSSGTVFN